jgi:hypothetical protein
MNVKDLPCSVKAAGPDDGLSEGEYRAIVSAFGNTDSVGDVVMPGAFTDTLKTWADKGDPIPLVWSHDWGDPFSHIGEVTDAKETDAGLEISAKLDLENPTAKQVYKLLKGRRVNNHSFAYDIVDAAPAEKDGEPVVELRKLDLLECGPCLLGANRDTPVLSIKTPPSGITVPIEAFNALKTALETLITASGTDTPGTDDDTSSGAKQEAGQPGSAVANDPARAPESSAEQPQSARSAKAAARLRLIAIGDE